MNPKEYEMKVIEKLIPAKSTRWNYVTYCCPRCDIDLEHMVQSSYRCKYCPECGQKVRWY